jgi:Skp family chaperone for outer membrane proteins
MVLSSYRRTLSGVVLVLSLYLPLSRLQAGDEPDPAAGLVKALQDDHALVRKRAALALERLGPQAKAALPALEKALRDADPDVRAAAAAALERIDAPQALAKLLRRVGDKDARGKERAEACKELGERFGHDPSAVRALEALLTDPVINLDAARALEMIDTRAKQKTAAGERRGTRIALLNLKYVVMNYKKWLHFTAELRGEYRLYEVKVQALNAQMDQLKKDAAVTTDADEKAKIEKQARGLQHEGQQLADEAKAVLGKKESTELVATYKEITQVVTAYAEANDIDLVMHYNDATTGAELVSPENIQRKIVTGPTTPLYYKPGAIDISRQILERLNERHAELGPPAAGK